MKKAKKARKRAAKPVEMKKTKKAMTRTAKRKARSGKTVKSTRPAKVVAGNTRMGPVPFYAPPGTRSAHVQNLFSMADLLHDESEADDDGFIRGAGFDRYGGFEGDGLS